MASASSPPTWGDNEKLDLKSVRLFVTFINHHMHALLTDNKTWKVFKSRCTSKLQIPPDGGGDEEEHSVLSNLYWGLHTIEAANKAKWAEEKISMLHASEKMLQIPAALDEHGVTAGIPNHQLLACSYFYLSLLWKLQEDEWQVAIHFLQALTLSPTLIHTDLAPQLCKTLCRLSIHKDQLHDVAAIANMAKRYKSWLMYYQIIDFRETPQKPRQATATQTTLPPHESLESVQFEKVHPPEDMVDKAEALNNLFQNHVQAIKQSRTQYSEETITTSSIRCLKDILMESQSDSPISPDLSDSSDTEECFPKENAAVCSLSMPSIVSKSQAYRHWTYGERAENKTSDFYSKRFSSSFPSKKLSALGIRSIKAQHVFGRNKEAARQGELQIDDDHEFYGYTGGSMSMRDSHFYQVKCQRSSSVRKKGESHHKITKEGHTHIEQVGILEKIISKLCFMEELRNCQEDHAADLTKIYETLNDKAGMKYSLLKDIILDQLLRAISTSKEEQVIRETVSTLSIIISKNRSVIEDIKRKGLQLNHLATALKRNVHEAAILIYLINPSPAEIQMLEILPCLLDVICTSNSYKGMLTSLLLTPPAASLMIIEVLVTAHDYTTNNLHLSAISSPRVLSGLLDAPRNNNLEEIIALASVLVRCMQFDGKCRKHISHLSPPVAPFITLLSSNSKRATSIALEYFHELLCIPRSSAVNVLHQIQKEGSINNMCVLSLLQNSQPEHKPLAASLLLQLSTLEEISNKLINSEKAIEAFLESLMHEENSAAQKLSAFILSNLGGTYSWMGEPYTIPWLVKKAGLTSMYHRNMIKKFDFSDESLQDVGIDAWCGKLARCILKFGVPVFHALEKGLKSKSKSISRDCLVIATWLGSEVTKGMKKLVNFSEGVRESLRRLSNITWMAEELLKVADYIQPNKWRISCVHTQILEVCQSQSGAVTALIYYKGHLFSGHADGSIKVWDIKGQTASLVQVMKEHKRAVTCFSLFEPGNCLLSGSSDKRIKVWQMVQVNIECIETIVTKDSIRRISTHGDVIFIITHSNKLKLFDVSRKFRRVFKNKSVSFATAAQGKLYVGCTDSSIQELAITTSRQQEIKAPSNRWRWRNKTVNSIFVYKDWLYCAIANVEGSHIKEWKRNNKPQLSVMPEKGANVSAMEIVEDFIYFVSSASKSSLQIWLRGTQHKVGRLSAGSKITSLLSANDMILCGTETGMIKGWIPL
ncbi:PREDICTED: putative E3 ubiquitin-protein ligase LIN-1 isoform X2 [Ipomoea nil]|uniref:putative E3 ubiquitin-protein ligase LIN-1 isoform X2 n=1 Tax=Ipomoea nil TaxID=35883 RepID=UPI000901774C|nr:PREDICTED: putative E3 ubiquitin-protein ligase LIN-1 isoform X2 [Ipomoea nil]